MDTIYIAFGALILSIVHAVMPDHWIPLVMISRTAKWSQSETSWITALIAIPHIISTILLGTIIGIIGYKISSTSEVIMRVAVPLILIVLGFVYVSLDLKGHHDHSHQSCIKTDTLSKKTKYAIHMFFSYCPVLFSMRCNRVLLFRSGDDWMDCYCCGFSHLSACDYCRYDRNGHSGSKRSKENRMAFLRAP
ncbi:MAG: hypothetical protein ACE5R6_04425 [Candidatus Heimdallarchaeota archaeon]